ncbi:MAG: anti-sigma factor antagonist [Xanthomonadaceae bacterium]|nr:anti-sigma factor antagonist [Xanthomonadaceae bacterium]
MSFKVKDDAGTSTVFLSGEIDLERSPAARKTLLDTLARRQALVVDLRDVSYIDSSGIASLVEAYQKARTANLAFTLAEVGAPVMRVLSLARLDKVFPIRVAG